MIENNKKNNTSNSTIKSKTEIDFDKINQNIVKEKKVSIKNLINNFQEKNNMSSNPIQFNLKSQRKETTKTYIDMNNVKKNTEVEKTTSFQSIGNTGVVKNLSATLENILGPQHFLNAKYAKQNRSIMKECMNRGIEMCQDDENSDNSDK